MKKLLGFGTALIALAILSFVQSTPAVANDETSFGTTTIPLWGLSWGQTTVNVRVEAGGGVSATALQATRDAIANWNNAIQHRHPDAVFTLVDTTGTSAAAQIIIRVKAGGGMVQGQALANDSDGDRLFNSCKVNVSGKLFGSPNLASTVLSIAEQELGHCLGLLHANNNKDVMYGTLQSPPNTVISKCDMDAFDAVMAWLFDGKPETGPAAPKTSSVSCS